METQLKEQMTMKQILNFWLLFGWIQKGKFE
jgi:hypothetical protein